MIEETKVVVEAVGKLTEDSLRDEMDKKLDVMNQNHAKTTLETKQR